MAHPRFRELIDELRAIHAAKSSDYGLGDPIGNFRECEKLYVRAGFLPAWRGALVRVQDKYTRIISVSNKILSGEKPAVESESLKDTLKDLANYAILTLILYEEWEAKELEKA